MVWLASQWLVCDSTVGTGQLVWLLLKVLNSWWFLQFTQSGYKNIDDCSLQLESVPESETFSSASGLIPCNQELKSET